MFALPNAITMLRIVLVPVFAVAFVLPGHAARIIAFLVFAIAGASDWLDGFAARKLNAGSDFGRMLDPIADKVLVAVALMMLVAEGDVSEFNLTTGLHSLLRLVPALIILSREILVSGLREFLAGTRVSVPVTAIAKFKTAVQMVAIGAMILTPLADDFLPGVPALSYAAIAYALLWIAARAHRLYRRNLFSQRHGASKANTPALRMNTSLWVVFTLLGAVGQTARNAVQRELTPQLGALGATLVRFLFGFPFALLFSERGLLWTGAAFPPLNRVFGLWTILGATTQIAATALMLMTMAQRSFVVTVAYLKTEPVLVGLMGLVLLHDPLTAMSALAIGLATTGVAVISIAPGAFSGGMKPALLGLSSAALFALSAIGYRGAILALHMPGYLLPATVALAVGLTLQTALLLAWLLVFQRNVLKAIFALWRPSLAAGFAGAGASQMWFIAFALTTAANVRTLALVEVLFAQGVSKFLFGQKPQCARPLESQPFWRAQS